MSNVAAANVLLPSLACIGSRYNVSPFIVLIPVALSISLAFLFPIGTPPNAIIMTNKRVTISMLFKVGSLCTVVFLTTILLYCHYLMPLMLGELSTIPESVRASCG
jgi:sodium-dependent dicarboxylate transporter 2/3/5